MKDFLYVSILVITLLQGCAEFPIVYGASIVGIQLIKSGFIGKASIYPTDQQPYYKISMNALVEGHQQTASVFLFDEQSGTAELSELQPMHIDNAYFTVPVDQLHKGKKVITEGSAYIEHGEVVTPYNSAP